MGLPSGQAEIDAAVALARTAEVAVLCVGRDASWDTEGADLPDITLPGHQNALIAAVAAANPRCVVVLQTGGPVEMPWLNEVAAELQAWYPGQEAGNAIADVLLGVAEPGGRLPQTFPARWQDGATWSQDPEVYPGLDGRVRYEEGLFIGYRHHDKTGTPPLFPFGHGLSYSTFALSNLSLDQNDFATGGAIHVSVDVTNSGTRRGSSVVQLYVSPAPAPVHRPARELKAFGKLSLCPGETRQLTLHLSARDLAWFSVENRMWQVEAGEYGLSLGWSATDLPVQTRLTLAKGQALPL